MTPQVAPAAIEILLGPWARLFSRTLKNATHTVRLISPFVSIGALESVLPALARGVSVKLISRLYDRDFLSGASDPDALLALGSAGGEICAQNRRLHSKLYIFDDFLAIVSSSNLTGAGLNRNAEVGILLRDHVAISKLIAHFDSTWEKLGPALSRARLQEAADHIRALRLSGEGRRTEPPGVKDHGKRLKIRCKKRYAPGRHHFGGGVGGGGNQPLTRKYWIKFLWRRGGEAEPDEPVHQYADKQCAITFPAKPGRPDQLKAGDVVYETALTRGSRGRDWVVFARGKVACEQRRGIDELSAEVRHRYPHIGRYPYLIWLSDVDLIGQDLRNGVSLYEIFDEIGDDTFVWSQERARQGTPNREIEAIRYHRSHIELTPEAVELLDDKLERAFARAGKVHSESGSDVWWNDHIADERLRFRKVPYS